MGFLHFGWSEKWPYYSNIFSKGLVGLETIMSAADGLLMCRRQLKKVFWQQTMLCSSLVCPFHWKTVLCCTVLTCNFTHKCFDAVKLY